MSNIDLLFHTCQIKFKENYMFKFKISKEQEYKKGFSLLYISRTFHKYKKNEIVLMNEKISFPSKSQLNFLKIDYAIFLKNHIPKNSTLSSINQTDKTDFKIINNNKEFYINNKNINKFEKEVEKIKKNEILMKKDKIQINNKKINNQNEKNIENINKNLINYNFSQNKKKNNAIEKKTKNISINKIEENEKKIK